MPNLQSCPSACVASAGGCVACTPGTYQCSGTQPRRCDSAGTWQNYGSRACTGSCETCTSSATTATCTNVTTPPSGKSCSGTGICKGYCDGARPDCAFPGNSTVCSPETCNGTSHTPQAACTGSGSCGATTPNACGNNLSCGPTQCLTTCSTDTDCAPGYMCPSPGSASCTKVGSWVDAGARTAVFTQGPQIVPTGSCMVGSVVLLFLANNTNGVQYGWQLDTSANGDWCRTAQSPYYCQTFLRGCGTSSPTWGVYKSCTCISGLSSAPTVWTDRSYVENACQSVENSGGTLIVEEYDCL